MNNHLLEVRNLEVTYGAKNFLPFIRTLRQPAVHDVSFTLSAGETLALVGESGSGKTSIARAIAGLLVPAHGRIFFEGEDITVPVERRSRARHREIQYIFQNPDASLNPRRRIAYILGRPLEIFFDLSGAAKRRRIEQLLQDVHLPSSYLLRFPRQLSGGERQRVAIAQALAAEPKLILCDEIVSAIDVSIQATILDLLRELQFQRDIAYLFIAHDLAVVRWLAHRVMVLYQGRMMEVGTTTEIFSPPFHPYTEMLLQSVPEPDPSQILLSPTEPMSHEDHNEVVTSVGCPFAPRCPYRIPSICAQETPPWQTTSSTHAVFCHIPAAKLMKSQLSFGTPSGGKV